MFIKVLHNSYIMLYYYKLIRYNYIVILVIIITKE